MCKPYVGARLFKQGFVIASVLCLLHAMPHVLRSRSFTLLY